MGLYGYFIVVAARNRDRGYTIDTFERRGDVIVGDLLELCQVGAAQADHHDRHELTSIFMTVGAEASSGSMDLA